MNLREQEGSLIEQYSHVPDTVCNDDPDVNTLRFQIVNLRIRMDRLARFLGIGIDRVPRVIIDRELDLLQKRLDGLRAGIDTVRSAAEKELDEEVSR